MKAFRGGPGLVYVRCLLGFSRQEEISAHKRTDFIEVENLGAVQDKRLSRTRAFLRTSQRACGSMSQYEANFEKISYAAHKQFSE